jgi:hypothetical protein
MTSRRLQMIPAAIAAASFVCAPSPAGAAGSGQDSTVVLEGGADGTVFRKMTIEGEDRFKIEFERPTLSVDLDPASAPGLDWDDTWNVLTDGAIDLRAPLLRLTAGELSPYLPRPWLDRYAAGEIVQFRPSLTGVERWRLTIADSRRGEVRVFDGKGNPPENIGWDGISGDGTPMPPGYTYSYVVEAWDRAGNKRNFVGKGFDLPAYRMAAGGGLVFLFPGKGSGRDTARRASADSAPAAEILEAASRINQERGADRLVRIAVTARTYEQANAMAGEIAGALGPLLLGGPARIRSVTDVRADAPESGTVSIALDPEA